MKKTDWLQTFTGKKFYPLEPDAELICIEDIAHALSMQCRYAGHTERFYSVAQHSVLLAREFFTERPRKFAALMHDAAEAYLSDVPRPLKRLPEFAFYREAEDRLQALINEVFGIVTDPVTVRMVKAADREMLAHEVHALGMIDPSRPGWQLPDFTVPLIEIDPWCPEEAENRFLHEFYRLRNTECGVRN